MAASVFGPKDDRESVMRRLAIVLREIPEAEYQGVVKYLEDELFESLQHAISNLSFVDEQERQHAFSSFMSSFEMQKEPTVISDSLQLSNSVAGADQKNAVLPIQTQMKSESTHLQDEFQKLRATASQQSVSDLEFLNEFDAETLSSALIGEHPQSIALVLASIDPALAAQILGLMQLSSQNEVLVRIDQLCKIPHAAFQEVGAHFRSKLKINTEATGIQVGKEALKAIMEVMPLGQVQPGSGDLSSSACQPVSNGLKGNSTSEKSFGVEASEETQEGANALINSQLDKATSSSVDEKNRGGTNGSGQESNWTKDEVHEYLVNLAPKAFCLALSHVPTKDALVTLSGVPVVVANRVLALLSRSQAKSVQKKMNRLTSVSLAEIDDAKRKVCLKAHQIAGDAALVLKSA